MEPSCTITDRSFTKIPVASGQDEELPSRSQLQDEDRADTETVLRRNEDSNIGGDRFKDPLALIFVSQNASSNRPFSLTQAP
jgi:hypothetical protein